MAHFFKKTSTVAGIIFYFDPLFYRQNNLEFKSCYEKMCYSMELLSRRR